MKIEILFVNIENVIEKTESFDDIEEAFKRFYILEKENMPYFLLVILTDEKNENTYIDLTGLFFDASLASRLKKYPPSKAIRKFRTMAKKW